MGRQAGKRGEAGGRRAKPRLGAGAEGGGNKRDQDVSARSPRGKQGGAAACPQTSRPLRATLIAGNLGWGGGRPPGMLRGEAAPEQYYGPFPARRGSAGAERSPRPPPLFPLLPLFAPPPPQSSRPPSRPLPPPRGKAGDPPRRPAHPL